MTLNTQQISKWLKDMDLQFFHDTQYPLIYFSYGKDKYRQAHYIRAIEEVSLFDWQVQITDDNGENINIKNQKHLIPLIKYILKLNYNTSVGSWDVDLDSGDIRFAYELPLEDALMSKKQFKRIAEHMIISSEYGTNSICYILDTGDIPENDMTEYLFSDSEKSNENVDDEDGI